MTHIYSYILIYRLLTVGHVLMYIHPYTHTWPTLHVGSCTHVLMYSCTHVLRCVDAMTHIVLIYTHVHGLLSCTHDDSYIFMYTHVLMYCVDAMTHIYSCTHTHVLLMYSMYSCTHIYSLSILMYMAYVELAMTHSCTHIYSYVLMYS